MDDQNKEAQADSKKVVIYTTPTCGYCKMAKEFFTENNISYEEHDVVADEKARNEMMESSGQAGVPVITIGEEIVIGFDKDKISELLGISA